MINFVYRNKIYYVTHNGLQMLIYNEHKEEISFPWWKREIMSM